MVSELETWSCFGWIVALADVASTSNATIPVILSLLCSNCVPFEEAPSSKSAFQDPMYDESTKFFPKAPNAIKRTCSEIGPSRVVVTLLAE